jgi:hypothetical protein
VPADEVAATVDSSKSLASTLGNILKSRWLPDGPLQSSNDGGIHQPLAHETLKLLYMADAGSTHPFTNLWKLGATAEDICLSLPDDALMMRPLISTPTV